MTQQQHHDDFGPLPDLITKAAEDAASFYRSVSCGLSRYTLSKVERDELLTLMGKRGATERLLASNRRLRLQSTAILAGEFAQRRRNWSLKPGRRYWNVSFLGPLVNEYEPELDVDAYRQVVDRLLRSQKLHAIFAIELQAISNYPQKREGRSFLLNAHALAWTDDPDFDAAKAEAKLCDSPALRSEFGAPTVTFEPRDDADGQLEYLGYYLTKLPAKCKRRARHPEIPSRWVLLPVKKNVRADLQLRLFEVLSRLEVTDLVWGVNDGTGIRGSWKDKLTAWNRDRCKRSRRALDAEFDTAELWARIRSRPGNGSRLYNEPVLLGPRPRPIASETLPRQQGQRLWPSAPRKRKAVTPGLRAEIQAIRDSELSDLN